MEKEKLMEEVAIKSRLPYIKNEGAKKVADFLLDYCFKDTEEVYSNGSILVSMYRVLDALAMIDQNEIVYRVQS